MLPRRSRGRKIYVGIRSAVAVAAILMLGGVDEFLKMGRDAVGIAAAVGEATRAQHESTIQENGKHGNDG